VHPNAQGPGDAISFPDVERDEADAIFRPGGRFELLEQSLLAADSKTITDADALAEFVRGLQASPAVTEPGPIGLALSGGGIRSATFSLGVLQALARATKLASFDYLSTVSGGGYIGSWLSAWIHRTSLTDVQRDLGSIGPRKSGPMRNSEPEQVAWLRRYSNYLAPRVGLLSTDSLTLMAVWLRNVFLNLVVIVAFLSCVLLLPKALVPTTIWLEHHGAALAHAAAFFGLLFMPVAIAWNLSQLGGQAEGRRPWLVSPFGVLVTVLLPGTLAAIAGSIWLVGTPTQDSFNIGTFVAVTAGLLCACAGPWLIRAVRGQEATWTADLLQGPIFLGAFIIAAVPAAGILALTHGFLGPANDDVRQTATLMTVGPPIFLFAFGVGGSIYVGLVGRAYFERSREWWGRMNAWFFTVGTLWFVIMFSALFVPALTHWAIASAPGWLTVLTSLGWLGSLIAALGSRSKSNLTQAGRYNLMQVLNIAAFVFIAGFIILTSFATELLVTKAAGVAITAPAEPPQLSSLDLSLQGTRSQMQSHLSLKESSSPKPGAYIDAHMAALKEVMNARFPWLGIPFLWGAFALALGIFALFGWRIDVNKFSLHNLYKNRLIRCYLGASNIAGRNAQPFTGFDDGDDFPLRQLGGTATGASADSLEPAQRPFHVINATLNLAQGKNLAWQERKGASFVLTPRHCGFSLSNVQGDSTEMEIRGIPRHTAGGTSALPAAAANPPSSNRPAPC